MVGMGEVVPARTSPTLHPPSPPTVHHLPRLALYELNELWKHTSGEVLNRLEEFICDLF